MKSAGGRRRRPVVGRSSHLEAERHARGGRGVSHTGLVAKHLRLAGHLPPVEAVAPVPVGATRGDGAVLAVEVDVEAEGHDVGVDGRVEAFIDDAVQVGTAETICARGEKMADWVI